MGNVEISGAGAGSGDDEDMEPESPSLAEGGTASAAEPEDGSPSGGNGDGGARSGRPGSTRTRTPAPSHGLPSPEALMEQVRLREAAGRAGDVSGVAVAESVISRNESALLRWLEERVARGEEVLTLEQFCDMLESRDVQREECEEVTVILIDQSRGH